MTHLLRHVAGLGCLKISPGRYPLHAVSEGGNPDKQRFRLEDQDRLNHPGKDTALYLAAGAKHVELLRHWDRGLQAGLAAALARVPDNMPIVVESSSAARLLTPLAVVLVVRPAILEVKSATEAILPQVTDVVINAPPSDDRASAAEQLQSRLPSLMSPKVWLADLISEPPPDAMLTRLRDLLAS